MINIAVVEDDANDAKLLVDCIERYSRERGEQMSVAKFSSAQTFLVVCKKFDIVFMDIELPDMDGMTAAEQMRQDNDAIVLIFVTNMVQFAVRGYEVQALDFMVKPVKYEHFAAKLERAINAAARRSERKIEIRMDGDLLWLPASSVYYVEVIKHDLIYHTALGDYKARGSLTDAEKTLRDCGFRSCSRYCLVNMKHVLGIYSWYILVGDRKIEVSRRKRKELMLALMDYYGGGDAR